ncbi:uncharacterized protein [Solanum lycopersicum]|uniref:uncharacterized protein n=1 Tax=Solanum lycopersicum TaxID=4081 RepID=UPI003749844E
MGFLGGFIQQHQNSLEIIALEEVIKVNETQFELDPSGTNREKLHRSQVELRKHLQREEEFWKRKAGMEWFKEGERNTKFFHTIVKGRRKRMRFTKQEDNEDFKLLKELPVVINDEMNEELQSMPTKEEVKRAVMGLNKVSAAGPHGMSGEFFQHNWDTTGEDIFNMVKAFFNGAEV